MDSTHRLAQLSLLILAVLGLGIFAPLPTAAQPSKSTFPVEIVPVTAHLVVSMAISADGARVVSVGGSTVRLWDVATGRLLRAFAGHSELINSVALSPDGTRVLSGSADKTMKLWDAATGRLIRTFEGHSGAVTSVAFSPDGARALSGGNYPDKTVRLWDVATGRLLRALEAQAEVGGIKVAFSPDGTRVLWEGYNNTMKLWDAATGQLVRTLAWHATDAATGPQRALSGYGDVAFSPDGARVLARSTDKTAKLWDVATGRLLRTLEGHSEYVYSVAFSPDGTRALSGSGDKTVKLWEVATGRLLRTFDGHSDWVFSVAFSPDGKRALSGSWDQTIKLWDAATGQLLQTFADNLSVPASIAFPQEGGRVLTQSNQTIKLWDAASGRLLRTFDEHTDGTPVAFSPDGTRALSRSIDKSVKLWDAASGRLLRTFEGHSALVRGVALSPDGTRVLSGSDDKTIRLWDAATGQLLRAFEGQTTAQSLAFSPDGARALSGGWYGEPTVKVWDVATGRLLRTLTGHPSDSVVPTGASVEAVAFSPDGASALSGGGYGNKTIKLWELATGRLLRTFEGHSAGAGVGSVAFSSDGSQVLSGGGDRTMKLWDVASGRLLRTFEGHSEAVASVAFSPDGARVLSRSNDKTTRIWDVATGKVLVSMIAAQDGESVVITPEGFFTASKKGAELLSVVRGFEVYSIDQLFQALYRPDLVQEKLAGDPKGLVRAAAAKLDLDKVMASGTAPAVKILSPREGERVAAEQITAEAEITERGGGIGRIEWRINGLTLGVEARGLARTDDGGIGAAGAAATVKRSLYLEPGDNVVEVVTYNGKGLIASTPASIKVVREGGAPTRPRLHVLAVGVNDYYDSRLQLTYAVPDAKALGEALRKASDKIYDSVEITTVLDADVTTANLDRVFTEAAKKVRPSDVFVFFLAGHGKTVDGRYYFLPQDFRYQGEESISQRGVSQDRWQEWFARIPARKSILLYDTCESGTLTGDRVAQRGLERVAALDRMTQAMGRTVLTASTDDAPALEGYRGHGVFTYALLDALGRADTNRDGLIEVTGLAAFVDRQVPELSFKAFHMRQVPQMRIVGSNFPLANQIVVLPPESEASAPVISSKPTHFVITAADVFADTNAGSAPIRKLDTGTAVTLVKTDSGWTLIAREGKPLGYVATSDLVPIQ